MIKFLLDNSLNIRRHVKWGEVKELVEREKCFYMDIVSPKEEDIECLRKIFKFHPTNIEDCTTFSESPKMEEHKNYIFTVLHSITFNDEKKVYESYDVHIFLGENYIIAVHEKDLQVMHESLERIINGAEMKGFDCDYAFYSILDSIVDSYFPILTYWSEEIDNTEEYIYSVRAGEEAVNRIMSIRKGLLSLKRAIMPQREAIYRISHNDDRFIREDMRIYLRDVFDHIVKANDMLEEQRDMLSTLMDAHFSRTSAGLNEVMKRLTVLSTIFMPLTFIVGIYGMNFHYMPELSWKYGYFFIMLVMLLTGAGLIMYFKRKKWF